eukprot:scaffold104217_cov45-Phaeocystis_antarctica.AAC.1
MPGTPCRDQGATQNTCASHFYTEQPLSSAKPATMPATNPVVWMQCAWSSTTEQCEAGGPHCDVRKEESNNGETCVTCPQRPSTDPAAPPPKPPAPAPPSPSPLSPSPPPPSPSPPPLPPPSPPLTSPTPPSPSPPPPQCEDKSGADFCRTWAGTYELKLKNCFTGQIVDNSYISLLCQLSCGECSLPPSPSLPPTPPLH